MGRDPMGLRQDHAWPEAGARLVRLVLGRVQDDDVARPADVRQTRRLPRQAYAENAVAAYDRRDSDRGLSPAVFAHSGDDHLRSGELLQIGLPPAPVKCPFSLRSGHRAVTTPPRTTADHER